MQLANFPIIAPVTFQPIPAGTFVNDKDTVRIRMRHKVGEVSTIQWFVGSNDIGTVTCGDDDGSIGSEIELVKIGEDKLLVSLDWQAQGPAFDAVGHIGGNITQEIEGFNFADDIEIPAPGGQCVSVFAEKVS